MATIFSKSLITVRGVSMADSTERCNKIRSLDGGSTMDRLPSKLVPLIISLPLFVAFSLLLPAQAQIRSSTGLATHPLPGMGSGGAFGPWTITSLLSLPDHNANQRGLTDTEKAELLRERQLMNSHVPIRPSVLPSAPIQVLSQDASFDEYSIDRPRAPGQASGSESEIVHTSFSAPGAIDLGGASDSNYIFSTDEYSDIWIYNPSGSLLKSIDGSTFWCSGSAHLPVCSGSGFAGDARTAYDPMADRWIVTALWVGGPHPATDVIAVSKTADPTGAWSRYQFPACGSFDNWDGSDQPHTGFNSQWITVTSACSASGTVNGTGLAVFDKSNLYSSGDLRLNRNWFEFVDPWSGGPYHGIGGGNGTRDNPALTYGQTINNREYLTVSMINSQGDAAVVYSHVEGNTDTPVFYSTTETVTTSFQATGPVAVDAPGCSGCMSTFANGWIHSSGVFTFQNGVPYVISTMVLGDPRYARSTQIIGIATNTQNGAATALQLAGGISGSGPMAAEIAMPLIRSNNEALIVYDHSRFDFYPGVKNALWDIDTNSVTYVTVLREGSLTPNNGDQRRWTDFIDALIPIPGTSKLSLKGTVARPSSNDPQRSSYLAVVTP